MFTGCIGYKIRNFFANIDVYITNPSFIAAAVAGSEFKASLIKRSTYAAVSTLVYRWKSARFRFGRNSGSIETELTVDIALTVVVAEGERAGRNAALASGFANHSWAAAIAILAVTASFHAATKRVATTAGASFFGSAGASSVIGTNPIGNGLQSPRRFVAITAF